jgi:hypothetical protein
MEGSSIVASIKAEQEAQKVTSPTGAKEMRDLTLEEISMILQARAQGESHVTNQPTHVGY